MAAEGLQAFPAPERRGLGPGALALLLIAFVAAMASIAASPIILGMVLAKDRDYSGIGDIGQAYGAASAMIAGVAVFMVTVSVVVQHRQFRIAQIRALDDASDQLVMLAMRNPAYRQCWGARVSPEEVDEDLFYYCSFVVKLWSVSWERGVLDEPQARGYLQRFFDSEIPRLFWEAHGDWHRRGSTVDGTSDFRALINEEFLRAKKAGPPSRVREVWPPPGGDHFPPINRMAGRAETRRGRVRDQK